jgi:signal transduction protein with GAF and PtsI domain
MTVTEPTMLGLSEATHAKLKRLKEDGHFREMVDAYRFGIGLALAQGMIDPPEISSTTTVFSAATLDPDQTLRRGIEAIVGDRLQGKSVYRFAERLADWGIQELSRDAERGEIKVVALFDQLNAAGTGG